MAWQPRGLDTLWFKGTNPQYTTKPPTHFSLSTTLCPEISQLGGKCFYKDHTLFD
jgi:hypothetical protein